MHHECISNYLVRSGRQSHAHRERDPSRPPRPAPRLAIATVCLSGTLEDKLAAAAAAGFHGVEIFENDLIASPWSPHRSRRECARRGLSIVAYQPFRDFEAVPPEVFAANLRRAERKFDVLEQLGARTMLVCSSESADCVDDDDLAAEQLQRAGRAGRTSAACGSPTRPWRGAGSSTPTRTPGGSCAAPTIPPSACVWTASTCCPRGDDRRASGSYPGRRCFICSWPTPPRLTMDVVEWSRHHRLFPGLGSFDLPALRRPCAHHRVRRSTVAGGLQRRLPAGRSAPRRHRRDALAAGSPGSRGRRRPGARARAAADRWPATGAAHSVGTSSPNSPSTRSPARVVARALAALGFAHTAQHRSKPVQLWQQGQARILLNFAPQRTRRRRHRLDLRAGVESADRRGSTQRAETLLAPVLPRYASPTRPT